MRYIILLLLTLPLFGKLPKQFLPDLKKVVDNQKLDQETLDRFVEKYDQILTPYYVRFHYKKVPGRNYPERVTKIIKKGNNLFPLKSFRNYSAYKKKLPLLLKSKNTLHRKLAYRIITCMGDRFFEDRLLTLLYEEEDGELERLCLETLLKIKTSRVVKLIQFLYDNRDRIVDSSYWVLLGKFPSKNIQNAGYELLNDPKRRSIAVAMIREKTPKAIRLLRKAFQNWPLKDKTYPLNALIRFKEGNLLPLLKPCLDKHADLLIKKENKFLKQIYKALLESPTQSDRDYLVELSQKPEKVNHILVNTLLNSRRIDLTRTGIDIFTNEKIPYSNYSGFSLNHNSGVHYFLLNKEMRPYLLNTLDSIKNPELFLNLVIQTIRYDISEEAIIYLLKCLNILKYDLDLCECGPLHKSSYKYKYQYYHQCSSIFSSVELLQYLPKLLKNPKLNTSEISRLVEKYKLKNLQPYLRKELNSLSSYNEARAILYYLLNYTTKEDIPILKSILKNKHSVCTTIWKSYPWSNYRGNPCIDFKDDIKQGLQNWEFNQKNSSHTRVFKPSKDYFSK